MCLGTARPCIGSHCAQQAVALVLDAAGMRAAACCAAAGCGPPSAEPWWQRCCSQASINISSSQQAHCRVLRAIRPAAAHPAAGRGARPTPPWRPASAGVDAVALQHTKQPRAGSRRCRQPRSWPGCPARCAIPSTSLHRRAPNPAPLPQRRIAGAPVHAGNRPDERRRPDGAACAAVPMEQAPQHLVESWLYSRRTGGLAGVGTQVRCPAAASMRRSSQRGGAVYEKERESKAEEQKWSAASKAADQSSRRGGWRPAGCGAAHEQ